MFSWLQPALIRFFKLRLLNFTNLLSFLAHFPKASNTDCVLCYCWHFCNFKFPLFVFSNLLSFSSSLPFNYISLCNDSRGVLTSTGLDPILNYQISCLLVHRTRNLPRHKGLSEGQPHRDRLAFQTRRQASISTHGQLPFKTCNTGIPYNQALRLQQICLEDEIS